LTSTWLALDWKPLILTRKEETPSRQLAWLLPEHRRQQRFGWFFLCVDVGDGVV